MKIQTGRVAVQIHQKLGFSKSFIALSKTSDSNVSGRVFFPGCALMAHSPALVDNTYTYLKQHLQDIEMMSACCGKPSYILGERNKYQGELPFQSTLPEGKYNLNISHSGFYPYRDKVVIKDGKDIYSRVELLDIYWVTMRNRSLIFAGIGQYYYGDQAKGTIFTVLEAAGLLAGGILTYLYVREKNDRDNLYSKYRNEIDPNRARLLHNSISNKEDWMGIYQGGLISAFVTAAIIYSYNIFDVYSYRKVQSKRRGERTVRQAEEIFDELEEEENNLNE